MKIDENMFTKKPCWGAIDWLETQPDFETAWNNCERGDWMWWALIYSKNSLPSKKTSVAYARWYAKRAKEYADAAAERKAQADWIRKHCTWNG